MTITHWRPAAHSRSTSARRWPDRSRSSFRQRRAAAIAAQPRNRGALLDDRRCRSMASIPASASSPSSASPPADLSALQLNIVRSHAAGVGAPLAPAIVRLILLLKINALAQGASGISLAGDRDAGGPPQRRHTAGDSRAGIGRRLGRPGAACASEPRAHRRRRGLRQRRARAGPRRRSRRQGSRRCRSGPRKASLFSTARRSRPRSLFPASSPPSAMPPAAILAGAHVGRCHHGVGHAFRSAHPRAAAASRPAACGQRIIAVCMEGSAIRASHVDRR